MRAHHFGPVPGMAAPEAAASLCAAGAASVVADAVAPAGLNAQKESAPAAHAAQSREQNEHPDCASDAGADKIFRAPSNEFALCGDFIDRISGGGYEVSRRSLPRHIGNQGAVVRSLRGFAP